MIMKYIHSRFHVSKWTLCILIILAVGAYLRLHNIAGYMTFLGDEGRDALIVKRMIVDHKFTLLGPTASVGGFFLGPIYYYFMLPFLWLWRLDPSGPAVMVAIFGVATIYLLYRFAKELFNPWAGIFAASLYALSPVTIAYSRSSWNPNLVPFFSLFFLYALWRTVVHDSRRSILLAGVLLGIGLQLHYLFLFLIPVMTIWILLYGNRKNIGNFVLFSVIGFVIGYAPFLIFELRHGFPNTLSLIRFIGAGKDTGFNASRFFTTVDDVMLRSFGRLVYRLPQGELWGNLPGWQLWMWFIGTRITVYGSVLMLLFKVFGNKGVRSHAHNATVEALLLLWFLVVVILFGLYKRAIYDYYFGIIFAVPFICLGMLLSSFMIHKYGKWIVISVWILLVYLNWRGMPFQYPPNNQLAQAKAIAAAVLEKTNNTPFNFALMTNANSDHAYRYFLEIWGYPPVTIEPVLNDPQRQSVTDQLLVVCDLYECRPLGHPLWEIAGFGRAQIDGEWYVPFVHIFRLTHYTRPTQ